MMVLRDFDTGALAKELDEVGVGQTLLLVEDDPPVLRALAEVLRRGGYHVLKASGGREALRIQEMHCGTIHVMVTDVQMAELTGVELAESARELRPGLKVLFVSGSVPKSISFARVRSQPGTAFLQKPFFINSLLRTLEHLTDAEGPAEPPRAEDVLDAEAGL